MELIQREIYEPSYIENIPKCTLSVIVPLRITKERDDIIEKLNIFPGVLEFPKEVGVLIVDSGSSGEDSMRVRCVCRKRCFGYLRIETGCEIFSLGIARNHGAMYAQSEYILFQDIDCFVMEDFYARLFQEIEMKKTSGIVFFSPPVLFLNEEATRAVQEGTLLLREILVLHFLGKEDHLLCFKSPQSSCFVMRRIDFLLHGGFFDKMKGWGYEDFAFASTFIIRYKLFPLPLDFEKYDVSWDAVAYKNLRSCLRLTGDCIIDRNLVGFHFFHTAGSRGPSQCNIAKNREFLCSIIRKYRADPSYEQWPLPMMPEAKNALLDCYPNGCPNPFLLARELKLFYRKTFVAPLQQFSSAQELWKYVLCNEIKRLVVPNTRANRKRYEYFLFLKERGIECICSERGSLPGSVYLDPEGFCNDSLSYRQKLWDYPLTQGEKKRTLEYIENFKKENSALEKQSEYLGGMKLKKQLCIPYKKKILLVPLQRPSDTTILHHCGPIRSYANFINLVNQIADDGGDGWIVVAKLHPLEDKIEGLSPNVVLCMHNENINALLDICDAVLLINSGVGILSMMWNKPLIVTGFAFYALDDLCLKSERYEDILSFLKSTFVSPFSREKRLRFLHYLVFRFYSFGMFDTKEEIWGGMDGKTFRQTSTKFIRFYHLYDFLNKKAWAFPIRYDELYVFKSPLFDRYRHYCLTSNTTAITILGKKISKLFKNPRRFWEDSRIRRWLRIFWKGNSQSFKNG
ncbi:MAG: glycosyltransferase [Holosporaceae bacterium]|jgi:predicted glycosyltransferase involved in capsule biosynthesis|nr:glycosyltransferase [Holosporaceae bacterium]